MKRLILFLVLLILLSLPVHAQDSTSSAVSDDTIKESIKNRLEKVAGNEDTTLGTTASSQKQGWLGQITAITETAITIKTKLETKQIEISDDSTILDEDRRSIKAENLEVSSYIIAMGYLNNQAVLNAKRIVVTPAPSPQELKSFFTTISAIDEDQITITLDHDSSQTFTLQTDKDTTITQTVDSQQTEIAQDDLQVNDQLVVIALESSSSLEATHIHLVTSRNILADPDNDSE